MLYPIVVNTDEFVFHNSTHSNIESEADSDLMTFVSSPTPSEVGDSEGTHAFTDAPNTSSSSADQLAVRPSKRRKIDVFQDIREDQQKRFDFVKEQLTKVDDHNKDDMFGKFFASMADVARNLPLKQQIKVTRLVSNVMGELQEQALEEETIYLDLQTLNA